MTEMRTSHLFYSLRMIFNHTMPTRFQVPHQVRYYGPQFWSIERRQAAVRGLLLELSKRTDMSDDMRQTLFKMNENYRRWENENHQKLEWKGETD